MAEDVYAPFLADFCELLLNNNEGDGRWCRLHGIPMCWPSNKAIRMRCGISAREAHTSMPLSDLSECFAQRTRGSSRTYPSRNMF